MKYCRGRRPRRPVFFGTPRTAFPTSHLDYYFIQRGSDHFIDSLKRPNANALGLFVTRYSFFGGAVRTAGAAGGAIASAGGFSLFPILN